MKRRKNTIKSIRKYYMAYDMIDTAIQKIFKLYDIHLLEITSNNSKTRYVSSINGKKMSAEVLKNNDNTFDVILYNFPSKISDKIYIQLDHLESFTPDEFLNHIEYTDCAA